MKPVLSFGVTLILMGVAAMLLHQLMLWLGADDLVALLLFAAPLSAYLAYCTHHSVTAQRRATVQIYASFCLVSIASAGLVYVIG